MEFTEQQYRSLAEQNQWFRRLLLRCLPIVQGDAAMVADITRFAPLTPDEQNKHDTTLQDSELLVREIPQALNSPAPLTAGGLGSEEAQILLQAWRARGRNERENSALYRKSGLDNDAWRMSSVANAWESAYLELEAAMAREAKPQPS
jgi:hypothetical protein